MNISPRHLWLYAIIFLEGYVVLSVELLAIRQLLPFVGSGTDTVSIIIAAVLMPLAFGYYRGSMFKPYPLKNGGFMTVRRKLRRNLLISMAILTAGLSYYLLSAIFGFLIQEWGLANRHVLTALYVVTFIVWPVYLLGQTVPLVSHYVGGMRLPEAAGRILFFSTMGSFLGAVFATLVLMNIIGVAQTASVTIGCLFVLIVMLSKWHAPQAAIAGLALFVFAIGLNSQALLSQKDVVANNVYNTVQIQEWGPEDNIRFFSLNGVKSSAIFNKKDESAFKYVRYIEDNFIYPMKRSGMKGDILIVGAGGFTMGRRDNWNNYVFVDIDPALKAIAEEKFLEEKLGKNKRFAATPIRSFLTQHQDKFDLVIIDLGAGLTGIPEHLLTHEFFEQIRNHIKDGGILVVNSTMSPLVRDVFSQRFDNTIRSVFPHLNRRIMRGFNPWNKNDNERASVLYIAPVLEAARSDIYTDNKNMSGLDKPASLPY